MADRITIGCAVLLAAIYIYATAQFPVLEITDPLGPRVFPYLIGIGLLLSAGALLVQTLRARKARAGGQEQKTSREAQSYLVIAAVTVWTIVYVAVFEWLGYAIATSIYLVGLMAWFHRSKWTSNIVTSVLFSFISFWVFTKMLSVSLPRGILPF